MALEHNPNNPFQKIICGDWVETFSGEDRLRKIKEFNVEQLRQVIVLPGVQKTVKQAAERRLRKLEKAASKS